MPEITRMTRFGARYRIALDCNHSIERTPDEVKLQQLYIGKRVGCPWCAALQAADEMETKGKK